MEIEIRAFIKNIDDFKKRLEELGAKKESKKHIVDYWYCDKKSDKFEEVQQHDPGSYALRIRKTIKEDSEIFELNSKVLEELGDHNAFHEYETEVLNLEQTQKILESIGFKIFCIVDKKRETFKLNNCSINIENIKGFKPAVELEIIADEDIETHRTDLKNLLDELEIDEEDKIEKSITYLYMKEYSFKD